VQDRRRNRGEKAPAGQQAPFQPFVAQALLLAASRLIATPGGVTDDSGLHTAATFFKSTVELTIKVTGRTAGPAVGRTKNDWPFRGAVIGTPPRCSRPSAYFPLTQRNWGFHLSSRFPVSYHTEDVFARDLKPYEKAVNDGVTGIELSHSEFDALVSFTFNVGTGAFSGSTLLKTFPITAAPDCSQPSHTGPGHWQVISWKKMGIAKDLPRTPEAPYEAAQEPCGT
jgi:hypothetical protein